MRVRSLRVPAHRRHGEMDLARMRLGRRGDRVEPRLQAVERLQQARQRRHAPTGNAMQQVEQVGLGQLGAGPSPRGQRLQLQRRPRRRRRGSPGTRRHSSLGPRDVDLAQQHLAQRQRLAVGGHHLLAAWRRARSSTACDELRVLAGEDAEAVAGLVGEVGRRQVEHDVAHVLLGAGPVERMGVEQRGKRRPVARAAERPAGFGAGAATGAPSRCGSSAGHQLLQLALRSPCRPARSGRGRPRRRDHTASA